MNKLETGKTIWFIARTNPKCEERAEKALRAAKFRVYVPRMKKTIIHHRTKAYIDRTFVLFNRYIFVGAPAGSPVNFGAIRNCDGVEKLLGIDGTPLPLERKLVRDVMVAQRRGQFNDIMNRNKRASIEKRYPVRSQLRIVSNSPFSGFYGQVTEVTGRGTVKALMEMLGRMTTVELDPVDITPVTLDLGEKAA